MIFGRCGEFFYHRLIIIIYFLISNYQTMKVSGGAMNPAGGNPVCGSVPLALLNRSM